MATSKRSDQSQLPALELANLPDAIRHRSHPFLQGEIRHLLLDVLDHKGESCGYIQVKVIQELVICEGQSMIFDTICQVEGNLFADNCKAR